MNDIVLFVMRHRLSNRWPPPRLAASQPGVRDSRALLTARWRAIALTILCAHLALSYAHNYRLGANDDRLWLYQTGAQIGRTDANGRLEAQVAASLPTGATSKVFRYEARQGYRGNYLAATAGYRLTAETVRWQTDDLASTDYPAFLARAMYTGFLSAYVTACAIFVLIVATGRSHRMLLAVIATIALIALVETVFDAAGDTWRGTPVLLPEAGSAQTFWEVFGRNFPGMILNPHSQLSPFGDTPRNHFVLLVLALFALRWRGAYLGSYVLLAALSFLHQSQTGLLAAYLISADALLRPQLLRSAAGPLAAVTIALYLGRESLGSIVGIARPAVLALTLALAAAVLAALWLGLRSQVAGPLASALAGPRARLLARGPVAADLIVIATCWATTFPIAAVINAFGSEQQSIYFWTQLHGRSLGILRPPLVLGLTLAGLALIGPRIALPRTALAVLTFAGAALVPSVWMSTTHDNQPVATLESALRQMDQSVGPVTDWTTAGTLSEEQIYYALARALDQGVSPP